VDGKGRWIDNIFIERPWRSLLYEYIYIKSFETGRQQIRKEIDAWMEFYNSERLNFAVLNGSAQKEIYSQGATESDFI